MEEWVALLRAAEQIRSPRTISPFVEAGGVGAAIMTAGGNIYKGVCIDTCSGLGMCAERAAIAAMITAGENEIVRVVAVTPDGGIGAPCGACREMIMQLSKNNARCEILIDKDSFKTVKLSELVPMWWGNERFDKEENCNG